VHGAGSVPDASFGSNNSLFAFLVT